MARFVIYETLEYKEWFKTETLKSQRQILSRVLKIEEEGHFGHNRWLKSNGIWELKFNDGRRIYYSILPEAKVILLLGGNKNGQDKDIKKASTLFSKIKEIRSR